MATNFQPNNNGESSNPSASMLKGCATIRASRPSFMNKLKCLIVDDNKICRMILKAHLKYFGIEDCKEALNGKDAVNLFLNGETFDIVFIDCDMPIMDGPEAIMKLRSIGITAKIVGVTMQENREKFCNAGVDMIFEKPVDQVKLLTLLQEVAGKLLSAKQ